MNFGKTIESHLSFLLVTLLTLLTLLTSLSILGCGGGGYVAQPSPVPPPGPPQASVQTMQGQWEIVFHSSVSPTNYEVLEANLTQTGTHVFAGAPSALIYESTARFSNSLSFKVSRFGGECDSNGTDEVTFDATLTNITATTETVSFTLTETGTLGSALTSASISTHGTQVSGNYSRPAACGFPEDHGTFEGFQELNGHSAQDRYHGHFNSGADAIVATLVSNAPGFGLSASGTDNGTPFTLSGSTLGQSLSLSGTVSGRAVTWFGLYDSTYNVFQFYDSNVVFLGYLTPAP